MVDPASIAVGLMIVGLGVLLFKAFHTMSQMSGASLRASERERTQYFNLIERMVEKDTGDTLMTTRIHAEERVGQSKVNASVERESMKKVDPSIHRPIFEGEYATPEEAQIG